MNYSFSEQIRVEMARQQLTDEALSELSGVSRPIIADIRKGTATSATISTLQKLADALHIPIQLTINPKTEPERVAA